MRTIIIENYNDAWTTWFNQIRDIIKRQLKELAISVEHVGSTAVPGLSAKSIIDIDVVIDKESFIKVKRKLKEIGYRHQGDLGVEGREAFDLIDVEKKSELPAHYLYVCNKNNKELKKHIVFRDSLIEHADYKIEYEKVKRAAATKFPNDIDSYIKYKGKIIEEILKKALADEKRQSGYR